MKYTRHSKILEIIESMDIETQEELAEELRKGVLMLLKLRFQGI